MANQTPAPLPEPAALAARQEQAHAWFRTVQNDLIAHLEEIEDAAGPPLFPGETGRFERTDWKRGDGSEDLGGGTMAILRGRVFEKAGVHVSCVYGSFSEAFAAQIPGAAESDGKFWASGVSVIIHPRSPRIPAAHMNTRMLVTSDCWFGGGGDLTPVLDYQRNQEFPDAVDFHAAYEKACEGHKQADYAAFKEECDKYFHLPHRDEPRGIGGIFYDRLNSGDWNADMAFTKDVGRAFLDIYPELARRRMVESWSDAEREEQLVRRGRYAEFNLLYDRGTTFGLKTGGNVTSILSSMPPVAKWP